MIRQETVEADGSVHGTLTENGRSISYMVDGETIKQAKIDVLEEVRSAMEIELRKEIALEEEVRMITLYGKPNCPHCVAAKYYLDNHQIAYKEVNVMEDAEALAFLKAAGHRTVPQIYLGEKLLIEGGNGGLQMLPPDKVRALIAESV